MTDEESFLDSADEPDLNEPIDAVDTDASDDLGAADAEPSGASPDTDPFAEGFGDFSVSAAIEQTTKERDEYLDALRRLQADFENFRKRTMRQQTEQLDRASLSLVERLLPVLDALDLALAHATEKGEDEKETDLSAALVQIAGLARTTLEKEGLERIDDIDVAFDPTIHDAVSHVDDDNPGSTGPTVVNVMRAGYRLKGQVIRPAMVAVKG